VKKSVTSGEKKDEEREVLKPAPTKCRESGVKPPHSKEEPARKTVASGEKKLLRSATAGE
jgi:hypothetical protein